MIARLEKYVEFMIRHRWPVLALALTVTAACAVEARKLVADFSPTALFLSGDPVLKLYEEFLKDFRNNDNTVVIGIEARDVFDPGTLQVIHGLTTAIAKVPDVTDVISLTSVTAIRGEPGGFNIGKLMPELPSSPAGVAEIRARARDQRLFQGRLLNGGGTATAIYVVPLQHYTNIEKRGRLLGYIDQILDPVRAAHPELAFYLSGIPATQRAMVGAIKSDQLTFIPIALLIMCAVLVYVFRGLTGVLLPLFVIGATLVWFTAFMAFTGEAVNIINNIIFTLVLVYGIGDAIHVTARYREELAQGVPKHRAIVRSISQMVVACFMTSFTTMIGFGSLYTANVDIIKRMGAYAALAIGLAYVVTFLLLPVGFAILPPVGFRRHEGRITASRVEAMLAWVAQLVVTHARLIVAVSGGAIAVSAAGIALLTIESRMLEELSPKHAVAVANRFLEANLSGVLPFDIAIEAQEEEGLKEPAVQKAMASLQETLARRPDISRSMSLADFVAEMNRAFHDGDGKYHRIPDTRPEIAQYLLLQSISDDPDALKDFVTDDFRKARIAIFRRDQGNRAMMETARAATEAIEAFPKGVKAAVTGPSYIASRAIGSIIHDMLSSLASSFFFIALSMMIVFRSARIGLLSMIPNMLPIVCTMAFMGIVDIKLRIATAVIFSISLGIAVDNTIHFLARFMDEIQVDGDYPKAVTRTLVTTGQGMIFASLVLLLGLSVLLVSDFVAMRHFGILTGVTIITAMAGDLLLLPASVLWLRPKYFKRGAKNANV